MKIQSISAWALLIACCCGVSSAAPPATRPGEETVSPTGPLPEGATGLARKYPGDAGIDKDAAVLFADDFESYAKPAELDKRWDNVYQKRQVAFTSLGADLFRGKQSLEFSLPRQNAELSNALDKILKPERDILFLRYYSKYEGPYDVVGSAHNGASISAHYYEGFQATPGIRADGRNKFLVNLETWRDDAATPSPGSLNVYVYHPLQRDLWGDHFFPTGLVMPNTSLPFDFGPTFQKRPDFVPKLDKWYCYEFMVKANTSGKKDGRIAVWIDGALAADFPHLRLRDVDALKIDRFSICFHGKSNPRGPHRKSYDNLVAATTYIGPLTPERK